MALLLAAACSGVPLGTAGPLAGESVPRGGVALLLPVPDARDEQAPVNSSGAVATSDLRQIFSGHGYDVVVDDQPDLAVGLARARELGASLLVVAEITDWNEAVRDWRVTPDEVGLRISLLDPRDGHLVAWGHDVLRGDTSLDLEEPTHRLVQRLARRLVAAVLQGQPLSHDPSELDV